MVKRLVVVLATLLFAIPAFSAVLIDFDGIPVGSFGSFPSNGNGGSGQPAFDGPLAFLGIGIAGNAFTSRLAVITGEANSPLPFGANYLAANTAGGAPSGNETVTTVNFQRFGSTWFARGNTISLGLWDTEVNPVSPFGRVTVLVYDDVDALQETIPFVPGSGDSGNVAVTYAGLVSRIEIVDTGGDGYIMDNFGFDLENTAATPEPASVFLIGSGLILAGLIRRRRA